MKRLRLNSTARAKRQRQHGHDAEHHVGERHPRRLEKERILQQARRSSPDPTNVGGWTRSYCVQADVERLEHRQETEDRQDGERRQKDRDAERRPVSRRGSAASLAAWEVAGTLTRVSGTANPRIARRRARLVCGERYFAGCSELPDARRRVAERGVLPVRPRLLRLAFRTYFFRTLSTSAWAASSAALGSRRHTRPVHGPADRLADFVACTRSGCTRWPSRHPSYARRRTGTSWQRRVSLTPLTGCTNAGLRRATRPASSQHEPDEIPGHDLVLLRLGLVHAPHPAVDHGVRLRGIDLRAAPRR